MSGEAGALLDRAWALLERGARDPGTPANRPTLGSIGADGPALRTVVLRAADRTTGVLDIHSDARAGKVAQLRADPRAALHVWDPDTSLQLRIAAEARVHTGDGIAEAALAALPDRSRALYRAIPAPGTPIARPEEARFDGPEVFALIRLHLTRIEVLHLGRERHRRAVFTATDGWAGAWRVP